MFQRIQFDNKSLSTAKFTCHFGDCSGITVQGHEPDHEFEVEIKPFTQQSICKITKNKGFKLKPVFDLSEVPIPIDEQRQYLKADNDKILKTLDEVKVKVEKWPFEVMAEDEIRK